jgi:hypothetical protein
MRRVVPELRLTNAIAISPVETDGDIANAGLSRVLGTKGQEITSICADYLVADAVLRNPSPRTKFPANRENNWEYFDIWLFWSYFAGRNVRILSVLR